MRNLFILAACLVAMSGCDFLRSQPASAARSTCQQSCWNVAASAQSDCQTRCIQ